MANKKTRVFVATPTTGNIVDSQVHALREIADLYKDEIELVYPDKLVHRIFHDAARNGLTEDFLASDCDIMWFLDSDITPPKHILDLITMHGDKWQAAGAAYPVFMSVPGMAHRQLVFTAYKGTHETGMHPSQIPFEGTEFVDGLATGCLMLKKSVFEKLKKPYFEFSYDPITRSPVKGEDIDFCMKLSALGIQFFTDYSMVCRHQKNLCLLEMNNYCIDYANRAVIAYDKVVRENLKRTVEKSKVPSLYVEEKKKLIIPQIQL
jgi:hypothetical protein